jgi:putative transposase
MTHSFRAHYFHLIWSTKNRDPLIQPEIQSLLYSYLGGIVKNSNGSLLIAGGTLNHVHLLIGLSLPDKFSEFIRDIKACSSIWMKQNTSQKYFAWQEGYGSFSVSYSSLEKVYHYIKNQEEHHKTKSFDQEYLELLKKHNLNFDNRFVLG